MLPTPSCRNILFLEFLSRPHYSVSMPLRYDHFSKANHLYNFLHRTRLLHNKVKSHPLHSTMWLHFPKKHLRMWCPDMAWIPTQARHRYGRDTDFTHKNWSIGYDTAWHNMLPIMKYTGMIGLRYRRAFTMDWNLELTVCMVFKIVLPSRAPWKRDWTLFSHIFLLGEALGLGEILWTFCTNLWDWDFILWKIEAFKYQMYYSFIEWYMTRRRVYT